MIQLWLRITGRKISLSEHPWLDGPQGGDDYIGEGFCEQFAKANKYQMHQGEGSGLLRDFSGLSKTPQPQLNPRIAHFYEHTSEYTLDVWSQWYYPMKPLAWLLIKLVSPEINQLNLPLNSLDTSHGMTNTVVPLTKAGELEPELVCWIRKTLLKNQVVYTGFYAHRTVQGERLVRVVFPLPKGNVTVLLQPEYLQDGSFRLITTGKKFGGSGYYRLHASAPNEVRVRLIPIHEIIHVFESVEGELRTDHEFRFFGWKLLKLHYRMRLKAKAEL